MLRCFIAVDINEAVCEKLRRLLGVIGELRAPVRLADPEAIHVTLKFLGALDDAAARRVRQSLNDCAGCGAFEFQVRGLGAFPKLDFPRVFWAGIESGEGLARLHACVEKALNWMQMPEERSFHPHLTLARVKNGKGLDRLIEYIKMKGAAFDAGTVRVSGFHLYQSILGRSGARYSKLASFSLS